MITRSTSVVFHRGIWNRWDCVVPSNSQLYLPSPYPFFRSTLFNVKSCASLHDSRIQESTHGQRQNHPTSQDSPSIYIKAVWRLTWAYQNSKDSYLLGLRQSEQNPCLFDQEVVTEILLSVSKKLNLRCRLFTPTIVIRAIPTMSAVLRIRQPHRFIINEHRLEFCNSSIP